MGELGFAVIEAHSGEEAFDLRWIVVCRLCAIGAKATDEALGDDHFDGRGDKEWLDVHIRKSGEGARSVIGVQCTKHKVAGEGCTNGNVGGFAVTNFPDHDDVGILTENGAKGLCKSEADFRVYLSLVDSGHFVLDRVFHGYDASFRLVDQANISGQRSGFTGTGGAGDQNDAMGGGEGAFKFLRFIAGEAQFSHGEWLGF